ncbi:MAG: hypothetical protein IKG04_00095 [Exiguobacterium sp.]|nr:hypothetical protein [Exiguobacterium sp.]
MDEEKLNEENTSEEVSEPEREEETVDEIRDEDYANDDEIEMDRAIEDKLDKVLGKLDSVYDTISMFVDSGMTIREPNPLDEGEITDGEDFASEFVGIDDLDFSID